MSNVVAVLPYAVSIRDFVHSGVLRAIVSDPTINLTIVTLNPSIPELKEALDLGVTVRAFAGYRDSMVESVLKRIYPLFFADLFARVRLDGGRTIGRKVLMAILPRIRRLVGTQNVLKAYSIALIWIFRRRRMSAQLPAGTELVIGTRSLINSIDYGVMAEAEAKAVRTVVMAGSWDNFTTKGYFPFKAEKTLVWNAKMAEELRTLFKVPRERIFIVGYPRATLLKRGLDNAPVEEYLASIGCGAYRSFVLYSASYGELTKVPGVPVPLEYVAVKQIAMRLNATLPSDVCILIRMHPYSDSADAAFFDGCPRTKVYLPGRRDKYVERVMGLDDEYHLSAQLNKALCVVSLASTVSLDCLYLRKPVVNIDFDPVPNIPQRYSMRRFYAYDHFRDLIAETNLARATSLDEVDAFVSRCSTSQEPQNVNYAAFQEWYVPSISSQFAQNAKTTIINAVNRTG